MAWENVTTEPILESRCLDVTAAGTQVTAPFHLVKASPLWTAYEAAAGVGPVWPGPVVYGQTPYAVYGGFSAVSQDVIRVVAAHGMDFACRAGACAVAFPGLRAGQARGWQAAAGGRVVRMLDGHQVPVRGSLEAFQAAISLRHRRKEFGREWRRGTDSGLRLRVLHGTGMREMLGPFTKLAAAAAAKHDVPAMYGEDLFRAAMTVPGAVMFAAEHDGRLAGGILGFLHERILYLWTSGLDYSSLRSAHTYGWLVAESVRFAAAEGAVKLDLGRGNYDYKRRIGCEPVPLYALVCLTRPDDCLDAALEELSRRLTVMSELPR
jgi:hypothetical protein